MKRLALFAAVFAAAITLLRVLILLWANVTLPGSYLIGLLFSFSLAVCYGLLLGYLAAGCAGRTGRASLFWLLVGLIVFINAICFHYEAVFGRLPGIQLLFYLDQLSELSASLRSNIPPGLIATEVVVVVAVLVWVWKILDGARLIFFPRWLARSSMTTLIVAIGVNAVPGVLPESMLWASRDPLLWLARSGFIQESYDLRKLRLAPQDFDRFLHLHGRAEPGPMLDPEFPLCRPRPEPGRAPTSQDVMCHTDRESVEESLERIVAALRSRGLVSGIAHLGGNGHHPAARASQGA